MRTLVGLALLCFALLPTASAHATVQSDDGQWFLTVGHLNEPTSTWQRSGLDFIIRAAGPAGDNGQPSRVEHNEALNLHETMVATIIAPDGTEMDCPLQEQADRSNEHGVTNRYTCADPYILSQPGQYQARLVGDIDGSPVDGVYDISEDVDSLHADFVFPKAPELDPAALATQIAALETRIAQLEAHEDRNSDGSVENGIPALPVVGLAGLLLAVVAMRRR